MPQIEGATPEEVESKHKVSREKLQHDIEMIIKKFKHEMGEAFERVKLPLLEANMEKDTKAMWALSATAIEEGYAKSL